MDPWIFTAVVNDRIKTKPVVTQQKAQIIKILHGDFVTISDSHHQIAARISKSVWSGRLLCEDHEFQFLHNISYKVKYDQFFNNFYLSIKTCMLLPRIVPKVIGKPTDVNCHKKVITILSGYTNTSNETAATNEPHQQQQRNQQASTDTTVGKRKSDSISGDNNSDANAQKLSKWLLDFALRSTPTKEIQTPIGSTATHARSDTVYIRNVAQIIKMERLTIADNANKTKFRFAIGEKLKASLTSNKPQASQQQSQQQQQSKQQQQLSQQPQQPIGSIKQNDSNNTAAIEATLFTLSDSVHFATAIVAQSALKAFQKTHLSTPIESLVGQQITVLSVRDLNHRISPLQTFITHFRTTNRESSTQQQYTANDENLFPFSIEQFGFIGDLPSHNCSNNSNNNNSNNESSSNSNDSSDMQREYCDQTSVGQDSAASSKVSTFSCAAETVIGTPRSLFADLDMLREAHDMLFTEDSPTKSNEEVTAPKKSQTEEIGVTTKRQKTS